MHQNYKTKILLSSPNIGSIGGISRWTGHILLYYNSIKSNSNIDLIQYYPTGKGVYQNTKLLKRLYNGITRYLPYLKGLKQKLSQESFDVIHFVSSASFSLIRDLLAVRLAKNKGLKTVVHFRFGRIPELYKKRNWEQKLLHLLISMSNKIIVIDKLSYNTLIDEGYKNIVLLPNPLAPEINEIIKKNSDIVRDNHKILFAGHNVSTKGVFELIKACKEIPNVKLKLIGHVTLEMKESLFKEAGVNHDKWLDIAGEKDFETTIKEMLSAGIFVLPTYTEGFPNVIIEAMSCGCPIVATNVGAIPEMLDIQNGFCNGITVKPKNIDELKKALVLMLNDRKYANQCGQNASERVNSLYSMYNVWKQLEDIWTSINNIKQN